MKRLYSRIKTVLMPALLAVILAFSLASPVFLATPAQAAGAYQASDVIGQANYTSKGVNGVDNDSGFYQPSDQAVDMVHHRLFVADDNNERILVFNLNSSNNLIDHRADFVLGQSDFNSYNYNTTASSFHYIEQIAYDGVHDRLFVTDVFNHRVLVFDTSTITNGESAVHVLGQSNFTNGGSNGNGAGILARTFDNPQGIQYDAVNDRLFVSEFSNNRVLVFDVSSVTDYEDAIHVLGQPDFASGGTDTTAQGFNHPRRLAYDSTASMLYVTDDSNNRVLVFDVSSITDNEDAVHVLGQVDFTTNGTDTDAKGFNSPSGIAIDTSAHQLYVSDRANSRVLVFDTSSISDNEDAVNVLGQADFTSSGSDVNAKGFGGDMYGLYVNPADSRLYAADKSNHRVLIFDISSVTDNMDAVDVLGQTDASYNPVFTTNDSNNPSVAPMDAGSFSAPESTTIDTVHHRLFVTDTYNYRILIFNLNAENKLVDKTADNVLGCLDFACSSYSGSQGSLAYPGGTAYDSVHNRLFVSDLYESRVLVFDLSGGITNGMDASHVLGQPDFSTFDVGTLRNQFGGSYYGTLLYDATHQRLFVDDTYNNYRVMIYDLSGGIADGMDASHILGGADIDAAGDGNVDAHSIASGYGGFALDEDRQYLFVSNYDSDRVTVFDLSSGITDGMDASWVLGQSDFTSSSSGTTQHNFDGPYGMAYDSVRKELYVTDYNNYRIMVFDIHELTNNMDAFFVIGAADFTSPGNYGTSQSDLGMDYQDTIAFDSESRRLYFPDFDNNRVVVFSFANIKLGTGDPDTKVTIPDAKFGQPYDYAIPISGTQGDVTCSLESGTLPKNVHITSNCHVKGTPASNTPYTFTVKVTDDMGAAGVFTDTQVLGLFVEHASSDSSDGSLVDTGDGAAKTLLYSTVASLFLTGVTLWSWRACRRPARRYVDGRRVY